MRNDPTKEHDLGNAPLGVARWRASRPNHNKRLFDAALSQLADWRRRTAGVLRSKCLCHFPAGQVEQIRWDTISAASSTTSTSAISANSHPSPPIKVAHHPPSTTSPGSMAHRWPWNLACFLVVVWGASFGACIAPELPPPGRGDGLEPAANGSFQFLSAVRVPRPSGEKEQRGFHFAWTTGATGHPQRPHGSKVMPTPGDEAVVYAPGILGELTAYDYADPTEPVQRGLLQSLSLKQGRTLAWVAARGAATSPKLLMSTRGFLLFDVTGSGGKQLHLLENVSTPRLPVSGHNDDGINGLAVVRGDAALGRRPSARSGTTDPGCLVVGAGMAGNLPVATVLGTGDGNTTLR